MTQAGVGCKSLSKVAEKAFASEDHYNGVMADSEQSAWPWYWWPLLPLLYLLLILAVVALPILGPLSVLYFAIYPERHAHAYDVRGTAHQRHRLAQWRDHYRSLSFRGRVQRALLLRRRRKATKSARQ
ncbi:MAG: hypothetical protein DWQ37_13100 [Planctomycetota bacterium]|nr:MAG: hypothetical protein DWQ37_13100 [Planctomycetota bacterium]